MKVNLTKKETEYLNDKVFWDWKRTELDLKFEKAWLGDNKKELKKAHRFHTKREKFYYNLYRKLGGKIKRKENDENRSKENA